MPRDKALSHVRVDAAIKAEFLEKGYEGASIRSIGARAGMTSAGLYRHYPDKEAMFAAMVDPLIEEIREWTRRHQARAYEDTESQEETGAIFGESIVDLVREVILPRREEFRMLFTCAKGTRYENFIHDYVVVNQRRFMEALEYLRGRGYAIREISEEELHMLLSAYLTACFEPIIHDYGEDRIDRYLDTIYEFFMPGWMRLMGMR